MITSFVHIAQKPADNGPHSRFFDKVNPFQHLFTNCLHFQFFPFFPETPLRPDRESWAPICSHSACKCGSARGRPRKAVFPTGTRICEFFATSSGLLYAPHFSRNSTARSGTSIWPFYLLKVIGILSHDFLDLYPEVKHLSREGSE